MPLHDWTRVPSGLYHDFHQSWTIRIKDALNAGRLPRDVAAFVEQRVGRREADVLAVDTESSEMPDLGEAGGTATAPPMTRIVRRTLKEHYARKANRIVVKYRLGRTLAVIEIVSPGNKDGRRAISEFHSKTLEYLRAGVHMLIVDPFPPTSRDPFGIHKLIWDEFVEEDFAFPAGKDRLLVSYKMADEEVAYVEPIAIGDELPDMPLFLSQEVHVMVPLEATYDATWTASPSVLRKAVETGLADNPEPE